MILVKTILSFLFTLCLLTNAVAADNKELQKQRTLYQQANKALQTNQLTQFNILLSQLDSYPLKPYLEYIYLRRRLNQLPENTIVQFLFEHQGSFLPLA